MGNGVCEKPAQMEGYCSIFCLFAVMDLKTPPGRISKEALNCTEPKADCTLTISDDDMVAMVILHLKRMT